MLHGTQFINPSSSLSQSRPAGATTRLNGVSDNHIHSIRESYDRLADEYARRMFKELQHKPLDRLLLDRFAANVAGRGEVCDMGCGPGRVARYLCEAGTTVFGLGLSPRILEQARQLKRHSLINHKHHNGRPIFQRQFSGACRIRFANSSDIFADVDDLRGAAQLRHLYSCSEICPCHIDPRCRIGTSSLTL